MVMYLGQALETAPTEELFMHPIHPYTKALLAAIPLPVVHREEIHHELLKGEITSPIDPKPGCRFASRCPFASELCHKVTPDLENIGNGHSVACHRKEEFL